MVAYADDKKTKPTTGYICPKCFRELMAPSLSGEKDRYGRITRSYFGWCLDCNCGFEVIQFKNPNKTLDLNKESLGNGAFLAAFLSNDPVKSIQSGWLINKYRLFKRLEGAEKPQPVTAWLTMNPLPEPAPVVTGQGGQNGEFDKSFTPEVIDLVETVLTALKATVKTVESLLKMAKLK